MEIEITKMTSKGQIVIPQDIREKAGIKEGERFFVYNQDDTIVLKRTKNLESSTSTEEFDAFFRKMWKKVKEKGLTRKDGEEAIKSVRSH
jgi:AbrB family looped-hinge helix DNA binding protein